jgi:hypothetical protein
MKRAGKDSEYDDEDGDEEVVVSKDGDEGEDDEDKGDVENDDEVEEDNMNETLVLRCAKWTLKLTPERQTWGLKRTPPLRATVQCCYRRSLDCRMEE